MRSHRFLLVGLVLAMAACGDDSTKANPAPIPGSGSGGGVDASWVDARDARDASQEVAASDAADAKDGSTEATTVPPFLSVATLNVHQLFDTKCDSGKCEAGDFEMVLPQQQLDARAEQISHAIRGLKASVVMLQEIETQPAMDAVAKRLADLYPTAILAETGSAGSLDVAILTTGKLLEIRKHRGEPITRPDGTTTWFSREFLELHADLNGVRVIAFSAHFRSKSNDDPGRRQAEASAARDIMIHTAQEFPQAVVVMGGDLNDTPGSSAIQELEGSSALLRVASDMPNEVIATYQWNGQLQAIDHIFLETDSRGAYVGGSAIAVRDGTSKGLAGSDHAALRADFILKP